MSNIKNELSSIMRAFAQVLSEMNDKEFDKLVSGEGKFSFISLDKAEKADRLTASDESGRDIDGLMETIVGKLDLFETREDAIEYLVNLNLNKAELVKVASKLDIFITKNDKKDDVLEKIVEGTVGSKMRSKAIRETKLSKEKDR